MAEAVKIVYAAGSYSVQELYRLACADCQEGWNAGTLLSPRDGGGRCLHGEGAWYVGVLGPRGGFRIYQSLRAATYLCDALDRAEDL
jgi:hypothetical protein